MTALQQLFSGDISAFRGAFRMNRADAMVCLFYIRDPQGLGRREAFRTALDFCADEYALSAFIPTQKLIPTYGRWDDLLIFGAHRQVGMFVQRYVNEQWQSDITSKTPSLLAKYLPSENASSQNTKLFADVWARALYNNGRAMNNPSAMRQIMRTYRRNISAVRARLPIVERLMSAGQWDKIDYATVPLHALQQYNDAFLRHDRARYCTFLEKLNIPFTPRKEATIDILRSERYAAVYKAMAR